MPITVLPDTPQSYLRELERRITDLENTNVLRRATLDADGLLQQLDSNNVVRVEIGNLPARGSSPAQIGIRVNDSLGNPIFDTRGLFGDRVMKNLGIANGASQSFTTTTFTATSAVVNFTIASGKPPANIYAPFLATGRVTTNNGNVGFVRANLVGVTTSGNLNFGVLANFAQTSSGWIFVTGLAAGSYSIQLEGAVNATPQQCDVFDNVVQVFQLGG